MTANRSKTPTLIQDSACCLLDAVVRRSLRSFATDISLPSWQGREREMVSLYVMGHLLPCCGKSAPFRHPTQVGIEVAVPQLTRTKGAIRKKTVCKDVVIWPRPKMTCWKGEDLTYPLAVMEWKTVNDTDNPVALKRKQSEYQKDVEWLRATSLLAKSFVGYAVWVNRKGRRPALTCTRVSGGNTTERWLSVTTPVTSFRLKECGRARRSP